MMILSRMLIFRKRLEDEVLYLLNFLVWYVLLTMQGSSSFSFPLNLAAACY